MSAGRPVAMKRLYVSLCRRWGPQGMTISAWAFKHFQDTGGSWLRNRIDGAALFWCGERDHCQSSFQRNRAQPKQ